MAIKTVAKCLGAGCLLLGGTLLTGWSLLADATPRSTPSLISLRGRPPATASRAGQAARPVSPVGDRPAAPSLPELTDSTQTPLTPLGEGDPVPVVEAGHRRSFADRPTTAPPSRPALPADLFADTDEAASPDSEPSAGPPGASETTESAEAPEASKTAASGEADVVPAVGHSDNEPTEAGDRGAMEPAPGGPPTSDPPTSDPETSDPEASDPETSGAAAEHPVVEHDTPVSSPAEAGEEAGVAQREEAAVAGPASRGHLSRSSRTTHLVSLRGETTETSVRSGGRHARPGQAAGGSQRAADDRLTLVADEETAGSPRGELTPPAPSPASETGGISAGADELPGGAIDRLQQPLSSLPTRLQARRLPRVLPPGRAASTPEYESLSQHVAPLRQPALALHLPPPRRYTYDFRHRPLYFEQPGLERCGRSFGCGTNVVSATAFLAQAVLLPYQVLALGPCTHVAPLGDCPCGTLYPWCAAIPEPFDCRYDTTECHVE